MASSTGRWASTSGRFEFCERALRTGGSELEKASFHQNIGNGYFNLGQFSLAIESFKRAFVVKNRHNEWRGIALCNMNLGNSYGSMGDFARALEFHTEALAAAKAHADPVVEAQCHLNLGSTYVQTGDDASKAQRHYSTGLALAETLYSLDLMRKAHLHLAQYHYSFRGDKAKAYDHCQDVLSLSERAGAGLVEDMNRLAFATTSVGVLDILIPTCWELKGPEEAWSGLERSKAKALRELLRTTPLDPKDHRRSSGRSSLNVSPVYSARSEHFRFRSRLAISPDQSPGTLRIYSHSWRTFTASWNSMILNIRRFAEVRNAPARPSPPQSAVRKRRY